MNSCRYLIKHSLNKRSVCLKTLIVSLMWVGFSNVCTSFRLVEYLYVSRGWKSKMFWSINVLVRSLLSNQFFLFASRRWKSKMIKSINKFVRSLLRNYNRYLYWFLFLSILETVTEAVRINRIYGYQNGVSKLQW